jgi:feruloyl esterase
MGCIAVLGASSAVAQSADAAGQRCAALGATKLDGAKVTSAAVVPEKTAMPDAPLGPYTVRVMPAFCRVKVTDTPSADSDIKTEVWLPLTDWSGRVRGAGNGGFAGNLDYEALAAAVKQGSVGVATDTGHVGGGPEFALGHPEKVKDFGWRAVHDMTVQAKALAAALYGKAASHAYFVACSDGGREALMEAQRFPADYDGILAGAPAYNWTGLVSAGGTDVARMESSEAAYLPPAKLPAISAAVNAACDAKDGVSDGILNDPRQCGFDPATLACKGAETDNCLMPGQVTSLKEIYAAKKLKSGKTVFPGYLPGAEAAKGSWDTWLLGKQSLLVFFSTGYFSDFVHERADWKLSSFDFDKDYTLATEKTGPDLNATSTDLKQFAARGGKLVMYHGWDDPAIPALSTIDYYDGLVSTMGKSYVDSAVRVYMVPGMLHCGSGPGATLFGEYANRRSDAQHDVFTALEGWVESGTAPGDLIASKFVDDDWSKGVGMTRPLCVYPKAAQYVKGDVKDAKSFVCAAK